MFHEYLQETCFVITDISENLRKSCSCSSEHLGMLYSSSLLAKPTSQMSASGSPPAFLNAQACKRDGIVNPLVGADCQTIGLPLHRWALGKQSSQRALINIVECRPPVGALPLSRTLPDPSLLPTSRNEHSNLGRTDRYEPTHPCTLPQRDEHEHVPFLRAW